MANLTQSIVKKTMHTVGAGNVASARQLLTIFFQEIQSCSISLKQLWQEKDYQNLAMVGHKMAGACAYFGAQALHAHLLKIEALGKKTECDPALSQVLEEVFVLLEKVRKAEASVFKALDKQNN